MVVYLHHTVSDFTVFYSIMYMPYIWLEFVVCIIVNYKYEEQKNVLILKIGIVEVLHDYVHFG